MKIIEERELDNGAVLTISDESKNIAADRWYVKMLFTTAATWQAETDTLAERVGVDIEAAKEKLAKVNYVICKERNFIDHAEKDNVIGEILADAYKNTIPYLSRPEFVEKLFLKRLQEYKEESFIASAVPDTYDALDDDDGPADFSSCFK